MINYMSILFDAFSEEVDRKITATANKALAEAISILDDQVYAALMSNHIPENLSDRELLQQSVEDVSIQISWTRSEETLELYREAQTVLMSCIPPEPD